MKALRGVAKYSSKKNEGTVTAATELKRIQPVRAKQQTDSFERITGRLKRALARAQRFKIGIILGLTLLLAGMNALEPLAIKYIFDGLGKEEPLMFVLWGVGMLAALGLLRELSTFFSNWLTWRTRLNIHYHLLDITVERIHVCRMTFIAKRASAPS